MPKKGSRGGTRGRSARHEAGQLLEGAKPIEMGLFALGGYYLGDVLNQTGLPSYAYDNIPAYKAWVDAGYNSGAPNAQEVFGSGGGKAVTKVAGAAAFFDTLRRAAKTGLKPKLLNSELPFALGAMFDGPGDGGSTSSSGRW